MDKLKEMVEKFPTRYWNDSCSIKELTYAIERGATGATTNPVIVKTVLEKELDAYKDYISGLVGQMPTATEDEIAWTVIEKMAVDGAKLLEPVFEPDNCKGRLSIQTNTKYFRNAEKIVEQARYFATLAPNIQVKAPATSAGIKAFEEMTYHGVNVNATVSFTYTQAMAIGEAIERGLKRREAEGKDVASMGPVCTIMIGRLDDWLKRVVERDNLAIDPRALEFAGIACTKKAYKAYKERGYRTRVLTAAYRQPLHWTAFIGGDMVLTIPYKYQVRFNNSDFEVKPAIDDPVDPYYIEQLMKLPDFVKAYEKMDVEEFDTYGPVNVTLEQFANGYDDLVKIIRKFMIRY
ncbi:MAG: transaldolase family protein [Clostridiales Family XIII bacterium]|jgi:transaldolase|nr:transaldolase family protein [Clostridiales Family XIII bacterium]